MTRTGLIRSTIGRARSVVVVLLALAASSGIVAGTVHTRRTRLVLTRVTVVALVALTSTARGARAGIGTVDCTRTEQRTVLQRH